MLFLLNALKGRILFEDVSDLSVSFIALISNFNLDVDLVVNKTLLLWSL